MVRVRGERRQKPVAVVDIGSNSIRMVVYDGYSRTPVPIFNEKAVCALGEGMGASGRLSPKGVPAALAAIGRFVRLARAMKVESLDILATAAVRDASDGRDFVERVEKEYDVHVKVLSGGQEAKLAALGVICGHPEAEGMVADLGGGSVELVEVHDGSFGRHATLPLGVLRLQEASGGNRAKASDYIDRHLASLPWLVPGKAKMLYASGGAWRAIARICIAQTGHPLLVLDNFMLDRAEALRIIDLISRQSIKSLDKIPGVPKKRVPTLPLAALLLEKVLLAIEPEKLVFSVYGMREGQFFKRLPGKMRSQDPLLSACVAMAREAGRFSEHGGEILSWMAPLFPEEEEPNHRRLRLAACLLGDIFWNEHPDYRAEQALLRLLRLPFMGLDHRDRAELALSVYFRYAGSEDSAVAKQACRLLDEEATRRARLVGMALRLGHSVSGGLPHLLRRTVLHVDGKSLVLDVPGDDPAFMPDISDKRFDKLAKAINCESFEIRRV
ncbi:Ppx/GppA family phosphatase [Telmatospirillum sp. J64-1]|uniref:Ppx/GppA family phosphatase n=1 Tax=Telmatospirillum sp. J64-1 TaxID=2502183 RepID=UPI00115D19C9|nr:Ppx/GppA family phosphatase [Telmatospirillum sp. J64-1]